MKMEFKALSREYFEEYYYVLTNINKFIRKPTRKIKFVTKGLAPSVIFAIFFAITVSCLAIFDNSLLPYIILPVFALIIILVAYFMTTSRLKKLGEAKYPAKFSASKKTATLNLPDMGEMSIDWDDVKTIICGDHSIIFIPNLPDKIPIALPISARNKLKSFLKDNKLTDLLQ